MTATVGATGGEVEANGAVLSIPAGALPADTEITVTATPNAPPSAFPTWSSPVFRFEPAGLTFAVPVTVKMDFTGSPAAPTVWWTAESGSGFEALTTTVEGNIATAAVSHFSEGFVAPGADDNSGLDGGPAADAGTSGSGDSYPVGSTTVNGFALVTCESSNASFSGDFYRISAQPSMESFEGNMVVSLAGAPLPTAGDYPTVGGCANADACVGKATIGYRQGMQVLFADPDGTVTASEVGGKWQVAFSGALQVDGQGQALSGRITCP